LRLRTQFGLAFECTCADDGNAIATLTDYCQNVAGRHFPFRLLNEGAGETKCEGDRGRLHHGVIDVVVVYVVAVDDGRRI